MISISQQQYEQALRKEQQIKFEQKRRNTKGSKHTWTVKFEDIEFPQYCPILGLELDYFSEKRQENSISFDRLDNTKGYIPGNVVVVSWRANRIKNDGTAQEHMAIAQYLEHISESGNVTLAK